VATPDKQHVRVLVVILLVMVGIFLADIALPLGAAGGLPYVAAVVLTLWLPQSRLTLVHEFGMSSACRHIGSVIDEQRPGNGVCLLFSCSVSTRFRVCAKWRFAFWHTNCLEVHAVLLLT